ncbi:hypothetical protein EHI8A_072130 [Entamoeba histolytica HM-1:IMSS-B]|uniref:Uncharacterized protein n=4 Tax=Entamoeba histolytica TaxID=5759 RepID=C4M570_ENTH1|nr:hypothetical protein EHI_111600 [Entamoeba histolytica HM-1:IMSS]EAL43676.2 hypothetical protein EHI_111600 [Entamoeba histolytica HM-1:IMSS]EMH74956.1 hypothetical protein EHI8A_072130 [Entamoeba histolytica HM-1:IMSS-B]ENY64978.1 hypothetical protein EHI7A_070310 [Entamoeba histolytica HM-1:IMSS-A]GAT96555.1 hypothetical protein CL6EHI_111600 [Entamoeba histolytica]|eukprot:XP_649066.2 hypothetical protein EHI_111600 [Entamoeba histolytica HM-1:IMSS]
MAVPYCVAKILQVGASIDDIVAEFFGEEELINGYETFCSIAIMKITKRGVAKKLSSKEERTVMNGKKIEMTEKQEEADKNNTNKAEEKKNN